MNASHKLNKKANRLSRLARRLIELNAEKTNAVMFANKMGHEPAIGSIMADIHRLTDRAQELRQELYP